jgi:hypothetical protein
VNGFSLGPQSASPGSLEELTRLDVHPLAFAAGDKGEDECDQFLKGELACAGEMLRGLLDLGIDILGDQTQKTVKNGDGLA